MTNHRQIPISQLLFSFLEQLEEVGEVPCQNFPDLFHPELDQGGILDMRMAKKLCETCPLLMECRNYAVDAGEQHGIWGGMTVKERRAVRMAKKKATSSRTLSPSE